MWRVYVIYILYKYHKIGAQINRLINILHSVHTWVAAKGDNARQPAILTPRTA